MGEEDEYSEDTPTEGSVDSDDNDSDAEGPSSPKKNLTKEDIKRLLEDMKAKKRFGEIKNTGINTGGIKGTGKIAKQEKQKVPKR